MRVAQLSSLGFVYGLQVRSDAVVGKSPCSERHSKTGYLSLAPWIAPGGVASDYGLQVRSDAVVGKSPCRGWHSLTGYRSLAQWGTPGGFSAEQRFRKAIHVLNGPSPVTLTGYIYIDLYI